MREQPVYEQYSDDKSYKLEIHQRADGLYEVRGFLSTQARPA